MHTRFAMTETKWNTMTVANAVVSWPPWSITSFCWCLLVQGHSDLNSYPSLDRVDSVCYAKLLYQKQQRTSRSHDARSDELGWIAIRPLVEPACDCSPIKGGLRGAETFARALPADLTCNETRSKGLHHIDGMIPPVLLEPSHVLEDHTKFSKYNWDS